MVKTSIVSLMLGSCLYLGCLIAEEKMALESTKNSMIPLNRHKEMLLTHIEEDRDYLKRIRERDERTLWYVAHNRGFHHKNEINWRVLEHVNNWWDIWK